MCVLIVLYGVPLPVWANDLPEVFALPDGQAAEAYRVGIEKVLSERYGRRLETGRRASVFRWAFTDGELPPGLTVRPTGIVAGVLRAPREQPYRFRVSVVDMTPGAGALVLSFSLRVTAARIRLSRVDAPRLVPTTGRAAGVSGVAAPNDAEATDGVRGDKFLLPPRGCSFSRAS